MASHVGQVKDPATQAALRDLTSRVVGLQTRVTQLEAVAMTAAGVINAQNQRISNLADPGAAQDAVTVAYMRQFVQALIDASLVGLSGTFDVSVTPNVVLVDGQVTSIT